MLRLESTSFPEPSHLNALKNCLQKKTLLFLFTLELFPAQLNRTGSGWLRHGQVCKVVNGVLSVEVSWHAGK